MTENKVEKALVPKNSVVKQFLPAIHYVDAYKVLLEEESNVDIEALGEKFFTAGPAWISHLMNIRDRLVRMIGLKTSGESREIRFEEGNRIGIFHVLFCGPQEILLGEDDRHLNFRVSLFVEEEAAGIF